MLDRGEVVKTTWPCPVYSPVVICVGRRQPREQVADSSRCPGERVACWVTWRLQISHAGASQLHESLTPHLIACGALLRLGKATDAQ